MTDFTTKKELMAILDTLPDDTTILSQVVPNEGPGTWIMQGSLSGIIDSFKWEHPVAVLSLTHPNLVGLPTEGVWREPS